MKTHDPASLRKLDRAFFYLLLGALTLALAAVIWPFFGAVFWGAVLAILFAPFYRRLLARMKQRPK